MKDLNQIKLDAIVESHRKTLINSSIIIQILSMIVQVICLVGLFTDPIHTEAYCIAFTFFSLTALFGMMQYDKHKRDFK